MRWYTMRWYGSGQREYYGPGLGTKLIIIHYYRSKEGQIKPITAEAGQAQTDGGLIQLDRGLRQTAAIHL